MNFSQALESVKTGDIAYRTGWNTKWSFIELKRSPYLITNNPISGEDTLKTSKAFIHLSDENGNYVPWTPTQDDLLSEDWVVITSLTVKNKTTEENGATTDECNGSDTINITFNVSNISGNSTDIEGFSKKIAEALKRNQGIR